MKFNFRKIAAIASSALMVGMTAGVAAAANYPAPFVVGSSSDVAIVYGTGTGVSSLDIIQAGNIQTNLQSSLGITTGSSTTEFDGESAQLWSGSDRIYFEDQLGDGGVTQLTKDDFPTILADGTFDNGASNDYSQRIIIGDTDYPKFTFSDSSSDLTDPALIIDLSTSTTTPVYSLVVDFDSATNVTGSNAYGEKITLFGKEYTISSNTDDDELVLFQSSETIGLSIGGSDPTSQTVTVDGATYTVELTGASDTAATIKVTDSTGTSSSKEISEDTSRKVQGIDIAVDLADEDTATNRLTAQLIVGANEILLKSGDEVKVGSDRTRIDGTEVTLTGATNQVLTQIRINVTADDNDVDHLAVGDSFIDPVFGAVKLSFTGINDGPDLSSGESDTNTARSKIEILKDTTAALQVKMTDQNGETATIPFAYDDTNPVLADKDNRQIFVIEGYNLTSSEDEHYVVLNSGGEYVAMGQIKTFDAASASAVDLTIQDVFSGDNIVDWDDQTVSSTKTFTYKGKTFTVTRSDVGLAITDSDSTKKAVYPFIELFNGYDHRVAFTEDVDVLTNADNSADTTFTMPTGDIAVTLTDDATVDCIIAFTANGGDTLTLDKTTTNSGEITQGTVDYVFTYVDSNDADSICTAVNLTSAVDLTQTTGGADTTAALLIVEDKDATNSDAKEAVYIRVDDTGTSSNYLQVLTPIFTDTEVSATFDNADLAGTFDAFGTYTLMNSAPDQDVIEVTLPKTQMYAQVYMAEEGATITGGSTGGSLGEVLVKDREVSSVSTKNLIVVGGSCINSAAATLLGGAYCTSDFTSKTGVGSGQYLIKSFSSSTLTNAGKIALLVAGYDVADTVNAAKYLTTQTVDTSKEYKGTSGTSATIVA